MLEYILKILREAPHTFLHNMLYNMLNDSTFRRHITYNPNSDKFEIPRSEITPKDKLKDLILSPPTHKLQKV